MEVNRIECYKCRQCNRKGRPSVMRLSKYCDDNYIRRVKTKRSIFSFFTKVKTKYFDKRAKYNEDGTMKDLNTKGFRESWFWR